MKQKGKRINENKVKSERWRPGEECKTEGKEKMMYGRVGEWEMENMTGGKAKMNGRQEKQE